MIVNKYISEVDHYQEVKEKNLIGKRLKELRLEQGWSLQELSQKINCEYSSSALGKYERGERHPKRKGLERLAEIYDVDVEYLTCRIHVRKGSKLKSSDLLITAAEKKLAKKFSKCSKKEQQLIMYAIRQLKSEGERTNG